MITLYVNHMLRLRGVGFIAEKQMIMHVKVNFDLSRHTIFKPGVLVS